MKTIFYKGHTDKTTEPDYWLNNSPYIEWFVLENVLYEPNGSIRKRTINKEDNTVLDIVVQFTQDTFSDDGIVRRIALYISK